MPNRIRAIREERGKSAPGAFTLAAVANRLGVTESAVWRWEQGRARPSRRNARALARLLGVDLEDLGLDDPAHGGADERPSESGRVAG